MVSNLRISVSIPIKWAFPLPGWAKLNTNGSSLGILGLADVGGVIVGFGLRVFLGY
jgi:hypothetical protein